VRGGGGEPGAGRGAHSGHIGGASLGGLLIAFAGPGWGLLVDAATFAVAGVCFWFVRVPVASAVVFVVATAAMAASRSVRALENVPATVPAS